ncbi:MAG: hypothetical protein JO342_15560 [Solirubrobacterales bacterium]|nr:hypothetical protein [Solirubrobacterales bacterium]
MPATARRPSERQRAERRHADRERARHAVEQLRSTEGWQAWLSSRRHFRTYSLQNQLLVAMQRPTATRVAGFRRWLELGYQVRRRPEAVPDGAWAIRIWAPCPPSRQQLEQWRNDGADPANAPHTFYKQVCVFADDQVDPMPPPATPVPMEPPIRDVDGDQLAPLIPRLTALAGELECTVIEEPMTGHQHGYLDPGSWRIGIDTRLSANGKVKTLCHELAHVLIRRERQPEDPELDCASEELVVESVAYTCTGALGIRTDGYTIPYLASWAERAELEVLERTAGLVDRLAQRIEDAALSDPTLKVSTSRRDSGELLRARRGPPRR